MKKSILMSLALMALIVGLSANTSADDRIWGSEAWADNVDNGTNLPPPDGQVDEWGRFQLSFVPSGTVGDPTGTATIDSGQTWGKIYYITGVTSADATTTHRFLDLELYDIQGGVKIQVSGPSDGNIFDITPFLVGSTGPTGDVTGQRLFNPGRYVFDLSNWDDGAGFANTIVQVVAEGDPLTPPQGFEIRRVFLTDENLLAPVPEASSMLMLGIGLVGLVGYMRSRLKK